MDLSQLEARIMPSQGTAQPWISTMLAMASREAKTIVHAVVALGAAVADIGGIVLGRLAASFHTRRRQPAPPSD